MTGSETFTAAASTGNTHVGGTLNVVGAVTFQSSFNFAGDLTVGGKYTVTASNGNTDVDGTLTVASDLKINTDKFIVTAASGNTATKGTLSVDGASTLSGAVTLASTLTVAGDVDVNSGKFKVTAADGSLDIATNKFNIDGLTGNTALAGTLSVTQAASLSDALSVSGATSVGSLTVTGTSSMSGNLAIATNKFTVDASSGTLAVNTNSFTVNGANGNTEVGGTLGVSSTLSVGPSGGRKLTIAGDSGNVQTEGILAIAGSHADTSKELYVNGDIHATGTIYAGGNVDIGTKFSVVASSGDTSITGALSAGATTLSSTLGVAGDVNVNSGKLVVTATSGNTAIAGTLGVTLATTLSDTLAVTGDVTVNTDKFKVTAVDGSLAIASNKFNVAGASGNTLIAGTLGVAGATTLSSTVDVTDDFNVNSKFTVTAASGDTAVAGTLGVTGISTFADEVKLANDNALVTHTGSTGMKITSSSGYVDVESVRFTGLSIGKDGDPNTILLADQQVTITGALDVTSDVDIGSGKFVVTASDGSLAIATDKFKVDGSNGNTVSKGTLIVEGDIKFGPGTGRTFTVAASSGNTAIAGTLSAESDFKVGADNAETFTVAASSGNTAVSGTLSAGATTVTGTLGVSSDMTVNTNKFVVTASDGSLNINSGKLTVAGASGNTAIAGTLGVTEAATLSSTLAVTGISTFADEVKLANDNALVTHTGSTGMKITSSSGYVDVESVRFTGLSIGKDDPNTILLADQQVTITGALDVTSDVDIGSGKFVVTASDGSLAIATDKFKVDGSNGNTVSKGTLIVEGDIKFGPGTGRTFTVAASSGNTAIAGTLSAESDFKVGADNAETFTVAASAVLLSLAL